MEKSKTDETSIAINLIKKETAGVFKLKDLREQLKALQVTLYGQLPYSLKSLGYIVGVPNGYMWAKPEPIHFTKVDEILTHARKEVKSWSKRYNQKKKTEVVQEPTIIEEEIVPVQEHKELVPVDKAIMNAIKLLSEYGYRITKPVLIYEEVTIKKKLQ